MATYSYKDGTFPLSSPKSIIEFGDDVFYKRVAIDFSQKTLDAGDGDVAEIIEIPARTYVTKVFIRVKTAGPTNATIDMGYGGNDTWGYALALDSVAGTILGSVISPVYFATLDSIDIIATTDTADVDINSGSIEVVAEMISSRDTA